MAKNKKGKKNNSVYTTIKPFIQDNRVIFAMLGAVGAGIALGFVLGPEKAHNIVHGFTSTIEKFGGSEKTKPRKKKKKKKAPKADKLFKHKKLPKAFATENMEANV